jgi:glycosyltransferase involved in cell wall biosynthesis
MRESGQVLQICPHDVPPFADLCTVYAQALQTLGFGTTTIFVGPAKGAPIPGAIYLDVTDLSRTAQIAKRLRDKLADTGSTVFPLAICHRYRSWRLLLKSQVRIAHTLVVAHEFRFFDRMTRRWSARMARRTTFAGVSPEVTRSLSPYARDVATIANAIDVDAVRSTMESKAAARSRLGLAPSALTIGVVGRLHEKKQPELALAAFRRAALPDAQLVFVGDGPLRESLDNGESGVVFCGFVADARRYLRAFDVLLLSSGAVEAFGMVALEALLAGVPMICQRAAGPKDVLGDLGCYYESPSVESMSEALQRFNEVRGDADVYAHLAGERVQAHFSVAALARSLSAFVVGK